MVGGEGAFAGTGRLPGRDVFIPKVWKKYVRDK